MLDFFTLVESHILAALSLRTSCNQWNSALGCWGSQAQEKRRGENFAFQQLDCVLRAQRTCALSCCMKDYCHDPSTDVTDLINVEREGKRQQDAVLPSRSRLTHTVDRFANEG